ncbi:MAG: tyrosine-protein phosphatase, partial [Chloroflexota bacterium]
MLARVTWRPHLITTADPTAPPTPILNLRDLGGHPTRAGDVVRRGFVYRSADLAGIEPPVVATALAGLGVRTVYDLRTGPERRIHPDRGMLPDDTRYVIADVMRDSPAGSPAHLFRLMADARGAEAAFGAGQGAAMFEERYREFVTMPSARHAFRRLFLGLADPARAAGLFHCTTGKDRTGWAAAALLLLLDVPEDAVRADYLASNAALRAVMIPALERFEAAGGNPAW